MGISHSIEQTKSSIQESIQDEILKRMMLQREVQMAVNIAKARDTIHVFGSVWLTLVAGVSVAKIAGKSVPPLVGAPIVVGALALGNMADMAYGNKLARVNQEAEYILSHERSRLVPFRQAPFAKFYTAEERAMFYDKGTPVGNLAPFSVISRQYTPK